MTAEDIAFLKTTLPKKSPHQMKIPDGGKDSGKWTGKEVRTLLLAETGRKVTLAESVQFLREIGLTPVPYHKGEHKDHAHANWRDWLSQDFSHWRKTHPTKACKRRETTALSHARKRSASRPRGAPTLAEREWTPVKNKYQLNDPLLESPNIIAAHLAGIAAKHNNKS